LDSRLKSAIDSAKRSASVLTTDIVLKRRPFKKFGKSEIQKLKVSPDTFVQMALQLAYYRLHKKPGKNFSML
jgi:carnitine O-acetyltransferase